MIWKDVKDVPGYMVSDTGLVKSCERVVEVGRWGKLTVHEKILKHWMTKTGYCIVGMEHNGKRVRKLLHRLVAETFIPNPENAKTVNHKDGDKTNCTVANLEWATMGDNLLHAYRIGLKCAKGSHNGRAKLDESTVLSIRTDRLAGMSANEIAVKYNVCKSNVYSICSGKRWGHVTISKFTK